MKSVKKTMVILALLAVFAVSFAMGHITAARSGALRNSMAIDAAERAVAVVPLLRASEPEPDIKAPSEPEPEALKTAAPAEDVEKEDEPEDDEPPFPLEQPVSGSVCAPYSLQAVYSETMQDWRSHSGMDIAAPLAAAVRAAADGKVAKAYEDKLWGSVIELEHKGGLRSIYKGVSTLDMVRVGEEVKKGDVISGVGTSPIESKAASHLHFETWQDGICVNPESYVVNIIEP